LKGDYYFFFLNVLPNYMDP